MKNPLRTWWHRSPYAVDELASAPGGANEAGSHVSIAMVKDLLNDRRAERRSKMWRVALYSVFFAGPLISYAITYAYNSGLTLWSSSSDLVGIVRIEGEISAAATASADNIVPALKQAFESKHVKAVVLSIDSPGGAPVEAERIYGAIAQLRAAHPKPVIAVINNLGASAAYLVALHADRIVAARYSLVGSIGAVLQGWDFHRALERVDVTQRVYASGDLKSMLNPYVAMSPAADTKAKDLVQKMGAQFRAEMMQHRGAKLKTAIDYTTGEVWGGIEAKEVGLTDQVGTVDDVVREFPNATARDFGTSGHNGPFITAAAGWLRGVMLDAVGGASGMGLR